MGAVDGRERRAPIDGREPAGIAVGQDVDPFAAFLLGMRLDQPEAMLADLAIGLDVLLADLGGAGVGCGDAPVARLIAHGLLHLIERPAKIDGGGAGGGEGRASLFERLIRRVAPERERHAIGGGRPDQGAPRTCMVEMARAASSSVRSVTVSNAMRQLGLVDDLDRLCRPD